MTHVAATIFNPNRFNVKTPRVSAVRNTLEKKTKFLRKSRFLTILQLGFITNFNYREVTVAHGKVSCKILTDRGLSVCKQILNSLKTNTNADLHEVNL